MGVLVPVCAVSIPSPGSPTALLYVLLLVALSLSLSLGLELMANLSTLDVALTPLTPPRRLSTPSSHPEAGALFATSLTTFIGSAVRAAKSERKSTTTTIQRDSCSCQGIFPQFK